jgi:hypothetical protein
MCIVIDINRLAPVFNDQCEEHEEYLPIKEWIMRGHGFLVFGGTKYKKELEKTHRYLRLIRQLKISGKAVAIKDDIVDNAEVNIKKKTSGTDCDDQHIIALLGESRCPLFCSYDGRSFRYIRDRGLYPNGMDKVRIYTSSRNQTLLARMRRDRLKNQE